LTIMRGSCAVRTVTRTTTMLARELGNCDPNKAPAKCTGMMPPSTSLEIVQHVMLIPSDLVLEKELCCACCARIPCGIARIPTTHNDLRMKRNAKVPPNAANPCQKRRETNGKTN
jgi:hypothetical protein